MAKSLLASTTTVGGMTMISRVLGFVRDAVVARIFGAGAGTDAFFVAFRIPNFLRRLFAEGAFSQAFVPVFSEYKTQRSHAEVQELADHVAGALGGILFVVTLVCVIASPLLVLVFAPGFSQHPDKFDLTVEMLRITFPYLFFISLTAFAGGILNSYGKFGIPALTPVFLNITLIIAAVWAAPYFEHPVVALAWGVFAAGVIQLLFQFPFLRQLRILPRPRFQRAHEGMRRILKLMLPAIFGSSVAQINLLVDTLIASFLVTGSVSWLYYSDRLVEFPLGVFGIALATVILPSLSQKHARAAPEEFSRTLDWGLRWVMVIGLPCTVGLFVLAGPLLATLFGYGQFVAHDVVKSSYSLMAFSLGLLGFIAVKVLAPGFYARQDTRTPVRIGIIAMVSNMAMNVILMVPLAHAGLALATSLSAFLNAGLLYRALCKQGVYRPEPGWWRLLLQVGGAAGLMALVLWLGAGDVAQWMQWRALERGWHLLLWLITGAAIYGITVLALGLRLRHLRH